MNDNLIIEPNYDITGSALEKEELDQQFLEEDNKLTTVPEDSLWNLDMINVLDQYKETTDSVKVAILDTGVSPSSALNMTDYINLIPGEEQVEPLFSDLAGHGTAVAQLIGARDAGILIVAAAGNSGKEDSVEYPAAYDEVVAVGSVDTEGEISDFSAKGEEIELMAPGELIPTVDVFDYITIVEGTSMSAAEVSGVASVILAKDKSKSPAYIRELLKKSARVLDDESTNSDESGYGLIDLNYAVELYDMCEETEVRLEEQDYGENDAEIEVCNKNIEARWSKDNHEAAANGIEVWETSGDERVMKRALRCPDNEEFHKKLNTGSYPDSTQYINGFANAIANTMYYYDFARECENNPMATAFENTVHPMEEYIDNTNNRGYSKWCLQVLNQNWDKDYAFGGSDPITSTKHKKAIFILGISIHNAMDMYAHQAAYKSGSSIISIDDKGDRDNIKIVPERYNTAKALCRHIYSRWKLRNSNGTRKSSSAHVFCVSEHLEETSSTDGFYIIRFYKKVRFSDINTAKKESEWIRKRTAAGSTNNWHVMTSEEVENILKKEDYSN